MPFENGMLCGYPNLSAHELGLLEEGSVSLIYIMARFLLPLSEEDAYWGRQAYFIPSPHLIKYLYSLPIFAAKKSYLTDFGYASVPNFEGNIYLEGVYYAVFSCIAWIPPLESDTEKAKRLIYSSPRK